jgi:nucleoside-diphosphate-sugar epimerase
MIGDWSHTRCLVVGGAGFVGSNLARELKKAGATEILVIDNFLSSERDNTPVAQNVHLWEGSVADDKVLDKLDDVFDYIFHLATYHGNQSSIHDPLADHENNLLTTLKLLHKVRHFRRLKKLVYAGAGCAVAKKTNEEAQPTTEDAPVSLEMDSPYSISKMVGEFYAVYFHKQHGLPTVRARFQNVYGPGEILGAGKWRGTPATVWRNVTPTFIYKALRGQALPLENEGNASRDFIYVDDIVRGLMLCALRGDPGAVYNLASGMETTIRELAVRINDLTGNITPVELVPARAWDRSGKRVGSTALSREKLGFVASVDLEEGLRRTIEWTKKNLELIEANIRKHAHLLKHP